jgi:GxxExxY protein
MLKEHKDFDLVIENKIANQVIGIAIEIHKKLGPGLLESVYQDCLYYKIEQSGLIVEREKVLPIVFEEMKIDSGYRVDLLVEKKLRRYSQ